jgi:F0F1-type ATP synthase epsilon subunit
MPENPNYSETLKVDIRNRKEQFFKGEAKTVSSVNDTGEFDVLPQHANFVTLIKAYVIVDKGMQSEKKFEIDNGVLAAKTDAVDVYLDF